MTTLPRPWDPAASQTLMTLGLYNLRGSRFVLADPAHRVTGQTITGPSISVDRSTGSPRLTVAFAQHADIHGTLTGTAAGAGPVRVPADKTLTFWLVPKTAAATSSARPWLIDGYSGTWRLGDTVPDPAKP